MNIKKIFKLIFILILILSSVYFAFEYYKNENSAEKILYKKNSDKKISDEIDEEKTSQNLIFSEKNENNDYLEEPITNEDGETLLIGGATNIVYYNQEDPRWGNKFYGKNDVISIYGCGPTALAMVVSSLTDNIINPEQMAKWSFENGYFCEGSGSYHNIIPDGLKSFGLTTESLVQYSSEYIKQELNSGNIIVALMDEGHFTSGGHFIILRGTTIDGKILIADPKSLENSMTPWDADIFIDEAKYNSYAGGPLWVVKM